MKYIFTLLILCVGVCSHSQIIDRDSLEIYEGMAVDTSFGKMTILKELVINEKDNLLEEERKRFLLLQRRVLKVYPYAKAGAENLTRLQNGLQKLKTPKEQKRYFKLVESYLEDEFEVRLKNLSRKEGQILVKLIHRQTGKSSYTLIKELKSGWKAYWSSNTAKLFNIDLKLGYDPVSIQEDFLIETILQRAFAQKRLDPQASYNQYSYSDLEKIWLELPE